MDNKIRERFLRKFNFDDRHIKFIINKTKIPFVLSDTGKAMICWDYGFKKDLHFYLPIHPKILIEFSNNQENEFVDEDFVKEFNQISKDESLINIYSNSIQMVFFTILPIAFVTTVPASLIIGRMGYAFLIIGTGLAILFVRLSYWVWKQNVKKYVSAGG